MNNQKNSTNPLMLIGLGVFAGWMAKKLFESDAMKGKRDEMMVTADELRDRLIDSDQAQQLQEMFGDAPDGLKSAYSSAQKQLVKELAALKTTFADLDKDTYMSSVAEIVKGLVADKALPEDQLSDLKSALEKDFRRLQKNRAAGTNDGRRAKVASRSK